MQHAQDARGFVCLADELSIGVLHQLHTRGIPSPARRVLGFDDSTQSREFGISSFSQHLPLIGRRLAETLAVGFRGEKVQWPEFREEAIPVELISR